MALFTDKRELQRQGSRVGYTAPKGFNKAAMAVMGYKETGENNIWGDVLSGLGSAAPGVGQISDYTRRGVASAFAKGTDTEQVFKETNDEFAQQQIANFGFGLNVAKTVASIVAGGMGAGAAGGAASAAGGAGGTAASGASGLGMAGAAPAAPAASAAAGAAPTAGAGAAPALMPSGGVPSLGEGGAAEGGNMLGKMQDAYNKNDTLKNLMNKAGSTNISAILKAASAYGKKYDPKTQGTSPLLNSANNESGMGSNESVEGLGSGDLDLDWSQAMGGGGLIGSGLTAMSAHKGLKNAQEQEFTKLMSRQTRSQYSNL